MTRRRAFLEVVVGYPAGVFMFSAIGSVALIFIAGVVTDVSTSSARLPEVAGVILFVAVILAARFKFRIRYRLKLAGKNVKTSQPIPQAWIDRLCGRRRVSFARSRAACPPLKCHRHAPRTQGASRCSRTPTLF